MIHPTLPGKPPVRKVGRALAVLMLVALVAPFVVYAVPQVVGADYGYVVLSGSMEPKISAGDAVIVEDVPAAQIERGDVITFRTGEGEPPTTHRVTRVVDTENGVAFKTKGDANEEADRGLVQSENVIGELLLVIPYLGYVVQFANSSTGFALLVVVPLALFVVSELWELIASTRTDSGGDPGATQASGAESETAEATLPAETSVESTSDPTPAAESTSDSADSSGTFVVTRSSLLLLLLLLAVYVPYSGYTAYRIREVWAFTVASGSVFAFLFVLGLYVLGDANERGDAVEDVESVPSDDAPPDDAIVRTGRLPPSTDDRTRVPVSSVGSLVEMATDGDDWVVFDADRETYFLPDGDALYLCTSDGVADGGEVASVPGEVERHD
ncbi:MAG: signal peptidase I [Haloferacaceae archaeon]